MPSASDLYPSNSQWLKADDLQGKAVVVKIDSVKPVELQARDGRDAETKLEIGFPGSEKSLLLNKTNTNALIDLFGDDYDKWIGNEIEIYATPVQGPNGPTKGIRLKSVASHPGGDNDLPF